MLRVVERGPEGYTYRALEPADLETLEACAASYPIVSQPDAATVLATAGAPAAATLGAWMAARRAEGQGVVLQLPPAPPAMPSPLAMLCDPRPEWPMTVVGFATTSLNEARSMAAASVDSFVAVEPAGGWLELRRGLAALSWGWLAVAAAGVGLVGYLVLRR